MIKEMRFHLIFLLFCGLLAVACTAVSDPDSSIQTEATAVPPTAEPSPLPAATDEPAPTLEPTSAANPDPTAVPTSADSAAPTLDAFTTILQTALINGDLDIVQTQMSNPFAFGLYRSEWTQSTPGAMRQQVENVLPTQNSIQFTADPDLMAMLDGQDPQLMLGPDVTVTAVWYSTGWGGSGMDEAILFIEEMADGRFAWRAMLYAPYGFQPGLGDLPIMDEQPAPIGLLYSTAEGGVWQIDANGQPQQLTTQAEAVPSPDGSYAFYVADNDLWLLDLATDERTQLTDDAEGITLTEHQQWVDNDTILTGVWLDFEADGGPNLGRLALLEIGSGEITIVDSQHLMSSYPAVSPDGAVAYSSVPQSANDTQTSWIYYPDEGVTRFAPAEFTNAVENAGYTSPAWSADGRFLAWLAFTGNNTTHLAVFDLEFGMVANLSPFQGVGFGGPYPNPVISPDPNWIALRQLTDDPASTGLWLYTQDGQNSLFMAHNGGESLWVNDHTLLFIDYDENFNGELQQYNTLTGVRSIITIPGVTEIFGVAAP